MLVLAGESEMGMLGVWGVGEGGYEEGGGGGGEGGGVEMGR